MTGARPLEGSSPRPPQVRRINRRAGTGAALTLMLVGIVGCVASQS